FVVKDTGIGIPESQLNKLFKSFSQTDSSTTRKYGGTGLGLVICKKLVNMMNGDISVKSEVGAGSEFTFNIVTKAGTKKSQVSAGENKELLHNKKILIVDDNNSNLHLISSLSKGWGMIPVTAASGYETLELLNYEKSLDLALLDMCMPGLDGYNLALRIRKIYGEDFPLILLTSLHKVDVNKYKNVFNAILHKPVKPLEVFNAILNVLSEKKEDTNVKKKSIDIISNEIPLKILVAEDNITNQKLAKLVLTKLGYQPDIANNGLEVLEAIAKEKYDLIFMDVQMPKMDGINATKKIISLYKDDRPKIIAMTAEATTEGKELCLNCGMDDYISKPFNIDELTL